MYKRYKIQRGRKQTFSKLDFNSTEHYFVSTITAYFGNMPISKHLAADDQI